MLLGRIAACRDHIRTLTVGRRHSEFDACAHDALRQAFAPMGILNRFVPLTVNPLLTRLRIAVRFAGRLYVKLETKGRK
jgi:hypothetical protein